MSRNLAAAFTLLVLGLTVPSACALATRTGAARGVVSSETEVIHVAPPTGERETDRASILAALDQVRPGGTVEFGPGQYLVGPIIRIDTPGITLLGHADGTVLRGCELDEYEAMEVDFIAAFERDGFDVDPGILGRCGQLHLTGGNVTVRGFTFEQSRLGLVLGCCEQEHILASGSKVIGNTISRVRVRDPFPGNDTDTERWIAANGSAIWVSPGSDENEIIGNTFDQVAGQAIFLEGDRNRVETRSASDNVRDLGSENEVIDAGSAARDMIHGDPGSPAPRDTLLGRIASLDAQYFEAYNRCDLDALDAFHLPDLEAYHDLGGGPVGWETVRQGLERGVCAAPGRIRRALVPGTLAVYPMAQFGAVQLADHLFFEAGEDGAERVVTAARMIALWRDTPGGWKISRLISYDHRPSLPEDGQPVPPDSFETRIIEVDGHPMRVQTAGWRHRELGQPIVVLENGAGTPLEAWQPVVAAVAGFAPVVAYDRSGIGQSVWDGQPPTPEHVNRKLRSLLTALGAEPPYVLVGFSWGGPLIQDFTERRPEEVAGLVFIDSPFLSQRKNIELAAFHEMGAGEAGRAAWYGAAQEFFAQAPPGVRAEGEVIRELVETAAEEPASPVGYRVPIAVLVAARHTPMPPEVRLPFDFRAFWEADRRHTVRYMNEVVLASPEATLVLATHAGHYIHGDDPALVIEAIRRVSFPDVTRQLRLAFNEHGASAAVERYRQLKRRYPADRFEENLLNGLGYELLHEGEVEAAIAFFELNVREYPQAANPYDSLGDAYSAAGRLADAHASYEKAVHLAEASGDARLPAFRSKLEGMDERVRQRR